MTYLEKINKLAEENMTEKGFKLWNALRERIPNIWERTTSSTGKYHKRADGSIPTIAEHTYEMLRAAIKIMSAFKVTSKTSSCDNLVFAIVLHDAFKYGRGEEALTRKYTNNKHDQSSADVIKKNKEIFLKVVNEKQFECLEEAVRYHSGIWSTDLKGKNDTDFFNMNVLTHLLHILDMLSTKDMLKTD